MSVNPIGKNKKQKSRKQKLRRTRAARPNGGQRVGYDALEPRQMLATVTSFNSGTGALGIQLQTSGDTAAIDIIGLNVAVNGSVDLDSAPGLQTATVGDIASISITGTSDANQDVDLRGAFSSLAGGALDTIDISDVMGISFDGIYELAGDLTVSADSATDPLSSTLLGVLKVGGDTIISYGDDVSLANVANDFVGPVSISAADVSLYDINALELGNLASTSALAVTAIGNLTQATGTNVVVTGDTTILAAAADVTLTAPTNDFQGSVGVTSINASFEDSNDFELGNSVIVSDLDVQAGGNISDKTGSAIAVVGGTTVESLAGNITLDNGTHSFGTAIDAIASGGNIEVAAVDDLIVASGDFDGNLTLSSGGAVSVLGGGAITVQGNTAIIADGDVSLDNTANDFRGVVTINAAANPGQDVVMADSNDLVLGDASITGNLSATAVAGAISQEVSSTVSVDGLSILTSGTSIDLGEVSNDFVGAVYSTATSDVTISDANDLELGTGVFAGDLAITAGGSLTRESSGAIEVLGSSDLDVAGNVVLTNVLNDFSGPVSISSSGVGSSASLVDQNDFQFGLVDIAGALSLDSGGEVTQDANAIDIAGAATIESTGNVVLSNNANDFGGLVDITSASSPYDLSLADANDLLLAGTGQYPGDLTLDAGGAVSWDSATAIGVQGDFSISSGADVVLTDSANEFVGSVSANGQNVSISDASALSLLNITASGNLVLDSAGRITDHGVGAISVQGTTSIASGDRVLLFSTASDFVGAVSVDVSSGSNQRLVLTDANDLLLDKVNTSGKFSAIAVGAITDTADSIISVAADGDFVADSLLIGEQISDQVDFNRLYVETTGHAEVHEDSDMIIAGTSAGSARMVSAGRLLDANVSTIDITGDASFESVLAINLGNTGTDAVGSGRVNLVGGGTVLYDEDSSIELYGTNSAGVLYLTAGGAITDADDASVTVASRSNFIADSVVLGDTGTDYFGSNSVAFEVSGNLEVTEDSQMLLTGVSTIGGDLTLDAAGSILDSSEANTTVAGNATFIATGILIGDQLTDVVNFGSLSFCTSSNLRITEDSDTNLAGKTYANAAVVVSTGNIDNLNSLDLEIGTNLTLEGQNVNVGNHVGDSVEFGNLTFNSSGSVNIASDFDAVLSGNSQAGNLKLVAGFISDDSDAQLNVAQNTHLQATYINLGDSVSDTFNTGSLTFQSAGNVVVEEDSDILLSGSSTANNLTLVSPGNIKDHNEAQTILTRTGDFTGVDLIIGELADDCFDILTGISGLTTNGSGIVNVQLGC